MSEATAKRALAARARLRRAVEEAAGLKPPDWSLAARAEERAGARGLDLLDYAALVEVDGDERRALVEALRVGETRFQRHAAQLEALARRLPSLANEAGGRASAPAEAPRPSPAPRGIPSRTAHKEGSGERKAALRVWSAGCATGEEAWTLAMLLAESGLDGEVLGTDLSEPALAIARAGRYPLERAAALAPERAARWLVPVEEPADGAIAEGSVRSVEVAPALRARVRFERANLLDEDARRIGRFDLVLCRNVLVHLDEAARRRALDRLADALAPRGLLLVGASETVAAPPSLEAVRDDGLLAFRLRPLAPSPSFEPARGRSSAAKTVAPKRSPAGAAPSPPVVRLEGDLSDGRRLAEELAQVARRGGAVLDLDGASCLDAEAARLIARLAAATPGVRLRAARPAVVRWIERHGLAELLAPATAPPSTSTSTTPDTRTPPTAPRSPASSPSPTPLSATQAPSPTPLAPTQAAAPSPTRPR